MEFHLYLPLIDPDIEIREMKEDEIETFYSICRQNSLNWLKKEDVLASHKLEPSDLLVAIVHGDEIVGTCFASQHSGIISGLAVIHTYGDPLDIQVALFEEACRHLLMKSIVADVPSTLRSYMQSKKLEWQWDIHLYGTDNKRIIAPACNCKEYNVLLNQGSYGESFYLHYIAPEGIKKKILFEKTERAPVVSMRLYNQEETDVIGCGGIIENDEGSLLIGPLLAPNENAARVLLRLLILYIKIRKKDSLVLMYAVDRSETRKFLEDAHFFKLDAEWSRYSRELTRDSLKDFKVEDIKPIAYALQFDSLSFL